MPEKTIIKRSYDDMIHRTLLVCLTLFFSFHAFAGEPLQESILHFWKTNQKSLGQQDQLSLAVQDLQTNQILVEIATTTSIKSASLIKLLVLEEFLRHQAQNQTVQNGSTQKGQEDLVKMIQYSSNTSFNKLVKKLGGLEKTQKLLRQNYPNTTLAEYIPETGRTYQNKIIVEELRTMLHRLWQHRILGDQFSQQANRQASLEILWLMQLPPPSQIADRLYSKTCLTQDPHTRLWDKTGFVRGSNGNAGVIGFQVNDKTQAYIIVSVIWRKNHQSINSGGKLWFQKSNFIHRRISEMTYAYFQKLYSGPSTCGATLLEKHQKESVKF